MKHAFKTRSLEGGVFQFRTHAHARMGSMGKHRLEPAAIRWVSEAHEAKEGYQWQLNENFHFPC